MKLFAQIQGMIHFLWDAYHSDTFWGVCEGGGTNHLGRILMFIRTVLLFCEGQLSEGYLHEFLCDSNYHIYADIEETFDIIVLNTKKQIYESNIDKYKKIVSDIKICTPIFSEEAI